MKVGMIVVTPKGLEALAKSIRILGGNIATLEVHKDENIHETIRVCAKPEAGWIDLIKGFDERLPAYKYGCVKCQIEHFDNEEVYKKHLDFQSKHGINKA